ncbi:MAG: pyruvate kinase [Pseudomonadales bacterium]|nr:pyruvate kinase [Candidatus Woesebacteria bacterium]MCB9800686.1 pyruvate kinase [Pseudomonadales bacterium]
MKKSTKIVATIGPATETEEVIEQLIRAGMNVARFNTKHGTPDWHQERIERVKKVAEKLHQPVAVLLDLQGPEIRITIPDGNPFEIKEGEDMIFTSDEKGSGKKSAFIPQIVIETLSTGDRILIDDGLGEFVVSSVEGTELHATALGAFTVSNRKTLNTPGVTIELPSLIPADFTQLDGIKKGNVDFVALSFVRNAQDIAILRSELDKRGLAECHIVGKIENQSAIDNIDELVEASDAIMVARGDLAVEVPFEELAFWQKTIIHKCRELGKPVITATQMLKSMVSNPRPTRAEVSDVANAIYDGTDAVMLSEETTIGEYPVKAVATQARIAAFNEDHAYPVPIATKDSDASAYITHSAVSLLEVSLLQSNNIHIDKIVCLTETGQTARNLSRFRPHVPVHALTSNESTYSKMALLYGVDAHIIKLEYEDKLESSEKLLERIRDLNIAKTGETVLLVHGTFWKQPGLTNTLSIIHIE